MFVGASELTPECLGARLICLSKNGVVCPADQIFAVQFSVPSRVHYYMTSHQSDNFRNSLLYSYLNGFSDHQRLLDFVSRSWFAFYLVSTCRQLYFYHRFEATAFRSTSTHRLSTHFYHYLKQGGFLFGSPSSHLTFQSQ